MLSFTFSSLLIWPSEAGKGEAMDCKFTKNNIMPVFGKEPKTGFFVAFFGAEG